MGLKVADNGGGDFERAPEGNHIGICYQIIDLGMQKSVWNDKESWKHKVRIAWELPTELMEDGRPFSVSKNYTASLSEKSNLRKNLESWRGRKFTPEELEGFDLANIIGKPCMVQVVHNESNGKIYANVETVASIPKGVTAPAQVNESLVFDLEKDMDKFDSLPDWLKERINTNPPADVDHPGNNSTHSSLDDFDDDIPF